MLYWGFGRGLERDGSIPWCRVVGVFFVFFLKGVWAGAEQAAPALLPPSASRSEDGCQGPKPATALGREEPRWVLPPAHPSPRSPGPPCSTFQPSFLHGIHASAAHPGLLLKGGELPQSGPPFPAGGQGLLSEITENCVLKKNPPFPSPVPTSICKIMTCSS